MIWKKKLWNFKPLGEDRIEAMATSMAMATIMAKPKVKYKTIVMHTKKTSKGMVRHKNKNNLQARGLKLSNQQHFHLQLMKPKKTFETKKTL